MLASGACYAARMALAIGVTSISGAGVKSVGYPVPLVWPPKPCKDAKV